MRYGISPGVAHQVVAGEAVLVDLSAGRMLGLNVSGSFIWSLLVAGQSEDTIAGALGERYGLNGVTARREVREFVGTLVARGLIVVAA